MSGRQGRIIRRLYPIVTVGLNGPSGFEKEGLMPGYERQITTTSLSTRPGVLKTVFLPNFPKGQVLLF